MNRMKLSLLALSAVFLAAGPLSAADTTVPMASTSAAHQFTAADVERMTENWKPIPKKALQETMQKYGTPQEMTQERLVWHNPGAFKRIELVNEEIEHDFPVAHKDCLKHVIDYKAPPEKGSDLAQFDGSVIIERTKGELSARCDSEAHNLIALNLANDIVTGKKSVEEARATYAETVTAEKKGNLMPIAQKLQFLTPTGNTADPDKPFMK